MELAHTNVGIVQLHDDDEPTNDTFESAHGTCLFLFSNLLEFLFRFLSWWFSSGLIMHTDDKITLGNLRMHSCCRG